MTKRNPYIWPSNTWLFIRDEDGEELDSSSDRRYDLSDAVMLGLQEQRKVIIAFSVNGGTASASDKEALHLEELIKYDFGFDGYSTILTRLKPEGLDTYAWLASVALKL